MFNLNKYESFKIVVHGRHRQPIRRETFKGAENTARRLHKQGEVGTVEGVWYDENGIHFDLLIKF